MSDKLTSFETAKLAYEKGFNVNGSGINVIVYRIDGVLTVKKLGHQKELPEKLDKGVILAPTQSELQTWLRSKNIFAIVEPLFTFATANHIGFYAAVYQPNLNEANLKELYYSLEFYGTYEEALEKANFEGLKSL